MSASNPLLKKLKASGAWLFEEFNFHIAESRYEPEHFGSALVTMASPEIHIRFNLDGRDSRIEVEVALPAAPHDRWNFERICTALGTPISSDGTLDNCLANLHDHLEGVIQGLHSRPLETLPRSWNEEAYVANVVTAVQAESARKQQAAELNRQRINQALQLVHYLAAPLLCLALFWRAPFIWFRIDDFAWLNLANLPLTDALFEPFAQGTIRLFSERLYFLSLTELFGITSWPFRAVTFAVWFLDLALIQLVGERLTGSRAAGLIASLLWTISPAIVTPIVWASAFNEVLFAFVILAAFYARLRGWRITEAVLFLFGFGVLEIIVVYPVLVLLHSLVYKRNWRSGIWMFAPAIAFALAHLYLIPKADSPIYTMFVDARLPATLWQYLRWTVGDRRAIVLPVLAALTLFSFWRLRSADRRPLFVAGWFLIVLAPVLPLANHIMEYYLTVPGIGLMWLAGWAMAEAWRVGWVARILAAALAIAYAANCAVHVNEITAWHLQLTSRIRFAVRAVEATAAKYPGTGVAILGMDEEAELHCVPHSCFQLVGATKVWMLPGPAPGLLAEAQAGRARVIDVTPPQARDVTRLWLALNSGTH